MTISDAVAEASITTAATKIAPYILPTPLLFSPVLCDLLGRRVSLKYELFQRTNSFKPRGAFHKLLSLSETERACGLVAVSGGNHGKAVAYAAGHLGLQARILMFTSTAASAVAFCREAGATVELLPDPAAAFARANELEAEGLTFVHPFADPAVIAGQGTMGLELLAAAPDVTDVIASIGGGGMIGGVAVAIHAQRPEVRIWGVETVGADAMSQALSAGHPVRLPAVTSLAATLGAPEVSPLTLQLAQQHLHANLVFPDRNVVADALWLLDQAKLLCEPAAACTLTAAREIAASLPPDAHLVLIICGGSLTLAELLGFKNRVGL
ncbi:MAG: threonine ammonia-lyase [Oscillochloridaceae bacterium umkhey_bin13]